MKALFSFTYYSSECFGVFLHLSEPRLNESIQQKQHLQHIESSKGIFMLLHAFKTAARQVVLTVFYGRDRLNESCVSVL